MVKLRAAELLQVSRRIAARHHAGRPVQPPQRPVPDRTATRRADGKKPRGPLDHHLTHILGRVADKGDRPAASRFRQAAHPFGASSRLAKAAPGHQQPDPPISRRRNLAVPGPQRPGVKQTRRFSRGERCQKIINLVRCRAGQKIFPVDGEVPPHIDRHPPCLSAAVLRRTVQVGVPSEETSAACPNSG